MEVYGEEITKTVTAVTRTVEAIECDICKEHIKAKNIDCDIYYSVTTGHNDWGNDSFESREHYHVCPKCIAKFAADYLQAVKSKTAYIEIETEVAYMRKNIVYR